MRLPVLERAPARCCPYHIASHPPEPVSVGNVALAPFAGAAESAAAWPAPQLLGVQSEAQVNDRRTKGDNQSPVNRRRPARLGVLRQQLQHGFKDTGRTAGLAAPVVPMRRRAPAMCPGGVPLVFTMGAQTAAARARRALRPGARDPPPSFSRIIRPCCNQGQTEWIGNLRSRYARDRCRGGRFGPFSPCPWLGDARGCASSCSADGPVNSPAPGPPGHQNLLRCAHLPREQL